MRSVLQVDIDRIVNELGPKLFEDFQQSRIVPAAVPLSPNMTRRRSTFGPSGKNSFLKSPMSFIDDLLFGWAQSAAVEKERGNETDGDDFTKSGYTTHDEGDRTDYDEVCPFLFFSLSIY